MRKSITSGLTAANSRLIMPPPLHPNTSLIVSNCLDNSCSIASLMCDGHVNCWIPRTTRVTAPIIGYDCKSVSKDVSCRGIKASVAHGTCDQQQKMTIAPALTINLSSFCYYILFNWSRFHYKYKRPAPYLI